MGCRLIPPAQHAFSAPFPISTNLLPPVTNTWSTARLTGRRTTVDSFTHRQQEDAHVPTTAVAQLVVPHKRAICFLTKEANSLWATSIQWTFSAPPLLSKGSFHRSSDHAPFLFPRRRSFLMPLVRGVCRYCAPRSTAAARGWVDQADLEVLVDRL